MRFISFNGISNCLGLSFAESSTNGVHFTFILIFLWSSLLSVVSEQLYSITYSFKKWKIFRQPRLIKRNAVSSKQLSCRYCYMDALHARWLNAWRKSLTATTQECCEQFWTSPGGNTIKSTSCTATYLPSLKLLTLDEQDIRDTAGEAGTRS